ncbi:MAG: DUF1587 domain-containing protein, partial [Planctomycetales bacterium]|nr:DUF1587 domain-containing protein [Planctomycetales bacterium]
MSMTRRRHRRHTLTLVILCGAGFACLAGVAAWLIAPPGDPSRESASSRPTASPKAAGKTSEETAKASVEESHAAEVPPPQAAVTVPLGFVVPLSAQLPAAATTTTPALPPERTANQSLRGPEPVVAPVGEPVGEPIGAPAAKSVGVPAADRMAQLNTEFAKVVRPFLSNYCVGCHGAERQESDLRLDRFVRFEPGAAETWQEVVDRLVVHEMPPPLASQPTADERELVLRALRSWLARSAAAGSGQVVLRRLNRNEYVNTLRDLLGVAIDPNEVNLPADATRDGFDNVGEELVVSPALLEKYLQVAQRATREAVAAGHPLFSAPGSEAGEISAMYRAALAPFARRAFRRPATPDKLA